MATIRDVAKLASVSVATVSRVLNQSGYFDKETKTRVMEAVERLGYERNVHWSRLASRSSKTILFLLGNRVVLNSMQMRLLVACEKTLQEQGYDLVFSRFSYDAETRASALVLPRLLSQPGALDGAILAGLHSENLLDALKRRKLPYTFLANNYAGDAGKLAFNCVLYDDANGCYEAARYLLHLGHRRIAFVGNEKLNWFARRLKGYRKAMAEAGVPALTAIEDWRVSNIDYGQLAAAHLLRNDPAPTAILAANDELAAGVWKELSRRGISIPKDLSLVGFGDRTEFSILEPSLTTVAVFEEQLGERLSHMLLDRLKKSSKNSRTERYPCKLIERHSCQQHREPAPIRTFPRMEPVSQK